MKRKVYCLLSVAVLLTATAVIFACKSDKDDDEDALGKKAFEIVVSDENGSNTSATLSIHQNGNALAPVSVSSTGTYTFDVSNLQSGTKFKFKATRNGYIDSKEEEAELIYSVPAETFLAKTVLRITKKADPVTIPVTGGTMEVKASNSLHGIKTTIAVPTGASGTTPLTVTATNIPTPASRGELEADKTTGSIALKTIELESNLTGNFEKEVQITFTLPQEIIDLNVELKFGSDSNGTWEEYPVTINKTEKTGTVSIPHFSRWTLFPVIKVTETVTETKFLQLKIGVCGESVTTSFYQTNPALPAFYQTLLGKKSVPDVSENVTFDAVNNRYLVVEGKCLQRKLSVTVIGQQVADFTYYTGPVKFKATPTSCKHGGGGGQ